MFLRSLTLIYKSRLLTHENNGAKKDDSNLKTNGGMIQDPSVDSSMNATQNTSELMILTLKPNIILSNMCLKSSEHQRGFIKESVLKITKYLEVHLAN